MTNNYLTDPCFRFCCYCGAEHSITNEKGIDDFCYVVCNECFNAVCRARSIIYPQPSVDYSNNEWSNNGKQQFLKRLYETTTNDEVRTKIMAELLSGVNND